MHIPKQKMEDFPHVILTVEDFAHFILPSCFFIICVYGCT